MTFIYREVQEALPVRCSDSSLGISLSLRDNAKGSLGYNQSILTKALCRIHLKNLLVLFSFRTRKHVLWYSWFSCHQAGELPLHVPIIPLGIIVTYAFTLGKPFSKQVYITQQYIYHQSERFFCWQNILFKSIVRL